MLKYKQLKNLLEELNINHYEKTKKGIAFSFYVNDNKGDLDSKRACYYVIESGMLVLQNVFGGNKVVNYTDDLNTIAVIINDVKRNG